MFKKMLPYIIGILGITIPSYIAYDIYYKSVKVTDFKVQKYYHSDALRTLDRNFVQERIEMKVDENIIESFYIFHYRIINKGNTPILPKDFTQPVTFSVNKPWKIMYIGGGRELPSVDGDYGPNVIWERINEQSYRMNPSLFNPSDSKQFDVYIIRDAKDSPKKSEYMKDIPVLNWTGRIVNVASFYEEATLEDILPISSIRESRFVFMLTKIELDAWEIYWFLLLSFILFIVAVSVSGYTKRLSIKGWAHITLLTLTMFLSMSTAEIVVFLLTPQYLKLWFGSYILFVLHFLLFFYILWPSLRGKIMSQKA